MLCGIFVGGGSRRMNGFPKALLRDRSRGVTLLARALAAAEAAGLEPVLVGGAVIDRLRHDEPACRGLAVVADAAEDSGPLAGLVALLRRARAPVIALACDMPGVDATALALLAAATPAAPVVAARRDDRWEPLFARYDGGAHATVLALAEARLAQRVLSLQGLLDDAGALALGGIDPRALDDVDTPERARGAGLELPPPSPSSAPVSLP